MKSEEAQAMNRLLKKLTALRATLGDDERALLDGFVVTHKAVDEVAAHAFDPGLAKTPVKTLAPDEVAAHAFDPGLAKTPVKTPAPDEVAAHVFDPGLAKTTAKTTAPDEVAAHAFDPGLAKISAPHPRYIVVFDAVKEIYRIA